MNYRQGDVFLKKTKRTTTKNLKKREDKILAHGEATGHHHIVLDGEVFVGEDGKIFVQASEGTALRHQDQSGAVAEHAPHSLEPGIYEVSIEEEYTPEGMRRVYD